MDDYRSGSKVDAMKKVAQNTIQIINKGRYLNPKGDLIDINYDCAEAIRSTYLYYPDELDRMLYDSSKKASTKSPVIEVTDETSQMAAHRLSQETESDVAMLNFASAKNPGGGFLWGATAQEEDIARCSALFNCLETQPKFYETNRASKSLLYTDYIIYSPKVPFFRVSCRNVIDRLDKPFLSSVITSPAPNLSSGESSLIKPSMKVIIRRIGKILAVAEENLNRNLVLGAWGCGVFANDPAFVADAFGMWLENDRFKSSFDRVVFGVYDPSPERLTYQAFKNRFK